MLDIPTAVTTLLMKLNDLSDGGMTILRLFSLVSSSSARIGSTITRTLKRLVPQPNKSVMLQFFPFSWTPSTFNPLRLAIKLIISSDSNWHQFVYLKSSTHSLSKHAFHDSLLLWL
ncbi:hypothetical protein BRADI_5g02412v3 [Brachypodium distachyon]|uniref:Uncharacterized protein n=1 Tax=Brachypodium distachyon TaxID=15368 RepID=A0A0Q3I6K9_BRADI|nr:hypothetical protein BRADI_5g02412v3 [Brachypodium distachyon]